MLLVLLFIKCKNNKQCSKVRLSEDDCFHLSKVILMRAQGHRELEIFYPFNLGFGGRMIRFSPKKGEKPICRLQMSVKQPSSRYPNFIFVVHLMDMQRD